MESDFDRPLDDVIASQRQVCNDFDCIDVNCFAVLGSGSQPSP